MAQQATCYFWAIGVCRNSAESCREGAHHLFPVIVESASRYRRKDRSCRQEGSCFWPEENCGFSHEKGRSRGNQNPRNLSNWREQRTEDSTNPPASRDLEQRHAQVEALVEQRGWSAVLHYKCERCEMEFRDQDEVVHHCKTCINERPSDLVQGGRDDVHQKQDSKDRSYQIEVQPQPWVWNGPGSAKKRVADHQRRLRLQQGDEGVGNQDGDLIDFSDSERRQ